VRVPDFSLYLITDRKLTVFADMISVVREALLGGVKAVQLREKDISAAELFGLAKSLRKITEDHGAKLLVNDRVDIALAVRADGVHLGKNSMPVQDARKILGASSLIGYSAHGIEEALAAEQKGADMITFGPVYYTKSKAGYGPPLGIEKLRQVSSLLRIPVYALGGVTAENIVEIASSGVAGVALVSAIMADADPAAAARKLIFKMNRHATFSGTTHT